jgi:hypothetical protein
MTPQENDMLTTLLRRLNQTPPEAKDADAETVVRRAVAARSRRGDSPRWNRCLSLLV